MPTASQTGTTKHKFHEIVSNELVQRWRWVAAVLAALVIGLVIGGYLQGPEWGSVHNRSSMSDCLTSTLSLEKGTDPPTSEAVKGSTEHCYSLLRSQGLLNTFDIWELNYRQQYRANGVLLWMVVAITLSGVVLAALQLAASYKLALAKHSDLATEGAIILERGKIALKSSITGLFILLVSFAFFLVFVEFVYRLDIPTDEFLRPDLTGLRQLPNGTLDSNQAPPKKTEGAQ